MLLKDFNKFNNNKNIKGSILHLNISFQISFHYYKFLASWKGRRKISDAVNN